MIEQAGKPTVFGVPPGADFVLNLFQMIKGLGAAQKPEFTARIHVLVPSRRMQRRLKAMFEQDGNSLLPRIGLVTDVSHLLPAAQPMIRTTSLARLLDLKTVVARRVALDARLSDADVIDLTVSLTKLLDEMQGEGVPLDRLEALDLNDQSGHWDQSLSFLRAIRDYIEALEGTTQNPEAVHRANVLALEQHWKDTPPAAPIIVAGSTGSRATTRLLMAAVSRLDQGKVLLPGFDFDLSPNLWDSLLAGAGAEDHPQYRFASFLKTIELAPDEVAQLGCAPDPLRNRLFSLALRPAPVTHQWLTEGPDLGPLEAATQGLTLIEARDTKEEACALALAIRLELENDKTIALITPDATLARRVTAEVSRWGIQPDDSGGVPLSLTPAGRFLRQTARIASGARDVVEVIALLKHPFTQCGTDRGTFMRLTQEFELFLRMKGAVFVDQKVLNAFSVTQQDAEDWVAWLGAALEATNTPDPATLGNIFETHKSIVEQFAGEDGLTTLFDGDAGQKTKALWEEFEVTAGTGTDLSFQDYTRLLDLALIADSARIQTGVHPDVMIWGTLEARVQGADVVIIGGLNEGEWPEQPPADPWLNRAMRQEVGLLLPDRQIGLAAHDLQQAVGAPEVILSRALRADGSETVPSRWLSRLSNLLKGSVSTGGDTALGAMCARGNRILHLAASLDRPVVESRTATRVAPAPPIHTRPREFAITDVQRLIRDPYAIYARKVLNLKSLDPLGPEMDARRKGTVFHKILEQYYDPKVPFDDPEAAHARLESVASSLLLEHVPDVVARIAWATQLRSNRKWLFDREVERRTAGTPLGNEIRGRYPVPNTGFVLNGTADRIDRLHDGPLVVFDYKTGTPPSRSDIEFFDRQLIIEALMAEEGTFQDVPAETVSHVVHVGVGRSPKEQTTELTGANELTQMPSQIAEFLTAFLSPDKGYMPRRVMDDLRYSGDYDHLARFGEWDDATDPVVESVGHE